jgi:glycosyltransferase involved in cell wall biosynthesis
MSNRLRIAAFGFRSVPLRDGCAGADKFASELFPRLVKLGHEVTGYNRLYPGQKSLGDEYFGMKLKYFRTVRAMGFDTILHSFKCTLHIIFTNTGDIVHIQNGGNSIWAIFLRIAGKKVFISQDGIDWERDKWPWYGRLYLRLSSYITAYFPNQVIFDNVFARDLFEKHFHRKYNYIPFGSDVPDVSENDEIFKRLGLNKNEYFLFVGRFIPDKGLHYLIPAFENLKTTKKLVLVGGSPNPSDYEKKLLSSKDTRIIFAGYVYGDDSLRLMKNAFCYIQPSDVEGLSPVILNVMYLNTPIICSNIKQNIFAVADTAILFEQGNVDSLNAALDKSLDSSELLADLAERARMRVISLFTWDNVAHQHEVIFREYLATSNRRTESLKP